jgi:hypothetical protein
VAVVAVEVVQVVQVGAAGHIHMGQTAAAAACLVGLTWHPLSL